MFGIPEIENEILRYIAGYGLVIVGGLSAIGIIWCIGTFVEMLLGINQPIEVEIRERHKRYDKYRDELWEEYAREEIKNRYGIDEYKDK
jgi:hypothetical protein